MNKQRLIDANALQKYMSDMEVQTGKKCCTRAVKSCVEEFFPQIVFDQPTIDPESLPIVQELHKSIKSLEESCKTSKRSIRRLLLARNNAMAELEKVKDESDDLKLRIETACQLCQKLSDGNNTIPMCKNGQCCPLNMEG